MSHPRAAGAVTSEYGKEFVMTDHKALFGGALFAAGLCAHTAQGQFNLGSSFGLESQMSAIGYSYNYDTYVYSDVPYDRQTITPGSLPTSATFDASAYTGSPISTGSFDGTTFSGSASVADTSAYGSFTASIELQLFFVAGANEQLDFDFDFLTDSPSGRINARLWEVNDTFVGGIPQPGTATNVLDTGTFSANDPLGQAGSLLFDLTEGAEYYLLFSVSARNPGAEIGGQITLIPTPGVAGMLGLAGLLAVRRRR